MEDSVFLPLICDLCIAFFPCRPSAVESIVALGPHRSLHRSDVDQDEKHTCILCSESHVVSLSTGPFVAVAYVQRSTVLSQENRQDFAATFQYQPPVTAKELCQSKSFLKKATKYHK